jgi:RimJ/RimL family protein N-acetyltransferase
VRTERLVMEPIAHAHAAGLVEALAHPEVATYLEEPDATTVAAMHARIDRIATPPAGEWWLNFAMLRDGVVIGRLEATSYGAWAEIAYLVGPAYQRRGYAREGVRWLVEHLRGLGVREVWAAVHPGNARSIALLEAVGFSPADPMTRPLGSYDAGDVVYMLG